MNPTLSRALVDVHQAELERRHAYHRTSAAPVDYPTASADLPSDLQPTTPRGRGRARRRRINRLPRDQLDDTPPARASHTSTP